MRAPVLLAALVVLAAGCTLPEPSPPQVTYPGEVLGGAPWTTLVVEIDHAPGYAPSEAAQAHLVSTLRNVTSKSEVRLVVEETLPAEPRRWTADALLALEREQRTTQHAEPVALLHVLYPAGDYRENADAAGVTIGGVALGPAVVFLDVLRELRDPAGVGLPALSQPEGAVERLERATLLHEVGHAFGLVNNGLPMVADHEDKENERHSSNPESVMYWSIDSQAGLRDLLLEDGSIPATFDKDDLADIRAAGGR